MPLYRPTIAQQKTAVGSTLHSTLIFQFLMGIYCGVFTVTIYIYCTQWRQKRFNSKFIAITTAVLFLITGISFSLDWYEFNIVFCKLGATRFSIVVEDVDARLPLTGQVLLDITGVAGFVLADGVLIWRCFHVCGRRLTASFLIPMGLFIVEIGLAITDIVFKCIDDAGPRFGSQRLNEIFNRTDGALFVVVSATSIAATFVICNKIYMHTTHNPSARRRLGYVIDSLIQSCGIYTAVIILHTILNFKLNTGIIDNPATLMVSNLEDYASSLNYVTSGLIPTLMIARLAATSHRAESISTESTSLVSLPSDLKEQPDPELASNDAAFESHTAGEEVSSGSSVIVSETRNVQWQT